MSRVKSNAPLCSKKIMVIFEKPWHLHLLPSVVTICFYHSCLTMQITGSILNPFWTFDTLFCKGRGVQFRNQMETSSLPMTDWKYWRIFDTHGHWAVISNTELSFVPRGFLFIRIWIMEHSCRKNTQAENTILFKNATL